MIFQQVPPRTTHTVISFSAVESDGYGPILNALKVITQVCRLWREVSFGTPALWTRIDTRGYIGDELSSLVQRSDLLPLSIFLDNVGEANIEAYSRLLQSIIPLRLHRVDIAMDYPAPPIVDRLLSFDGSTLRCLTISSPALKARPCLDRDNVIHTIPILQGHAHTLEVLAIVPAISWIPANHFPNLTHLYVSFYISVESPHPHDITFFLRNTPCLEILHLYRLDHRETPPANDPSEFDATRVELPRLRSLVFTLSAYPPAVEILQGLALQPSTRIRLDHLFIPHNSLDPSPIPADLGPLSTVTVLELTVEYEILFLVAQDTAESSSGGFWLNVKHEDDLFWDTWLLGLPTTLPLRNITTLRADVYDTVLPLILGDFVHLTELSVRLVRNQFSRGRDDDATPLVHTLCVALSHTHPVACPALRALALEWPRNMPRAADLGAPDIVAMLSTRARLGHPIRRLVVQAVAMEFGSVPLSHFSEQLTALAEHVEEFEECTDSDAHVCAFEMRGMWDVEGAEEHWAVDEKLRARYRPLWDDD
ncbi:hypothetical protein V8D89_008846 [Ganoderma adspersum]